jgi:hypothetical protein
MAQANRGSLVTINCEGNSQGKLGERELYVFHVDAVKCQKFLIFIPG